jgi:tyrosyl-tRNA synthetase
MKNVSILDFLSSVGRRARVSHMLARDSVKGRMEGEGISFAEFTYQLLQAYDFFTPFQK